MQSLATTLRCFCCVMATVIAMPVQAEWSMVVLPDTQNYTIDFPNRMPWFEAQTQWAVDAKDEYNIQLVVGTGDITARNDNWPEGSTFSEWDEAVRVFDTLTGELPYILPTGNHDYTPLRGSPLDSERDTTRFNDYFGETFPGMVPMETGRYENNYTRFTAPDGRDMLIFSLEIAPRPFVLDWATTIAAQYPDDTVMVATHINIREGEADPNVDQVIERNPKGNILWEWARTVPNLELILNGHETDGGDVDIDGPDVFAARLASTGDYGQKIHEIGFNTQDKQPGGGSWLRLYTFLDDGRTTRVRTYSPVLNSWLTDDRNDFSFQLTPKSADFNADSVVSGLDLLVWEDSFGVDGDGDTDGRDFLTWQRQFTSRPVESADFDDSGLVDGNDLTIWEASYGVSEIGDADHDGDSDGMDFPIWQQHFAGAAPAAATQVPEQASWLLFCGLNAIFFTFRVERSCSRSNAIALGL